MPLTAGVKVKAFDRLIVDRWGAVYVRGKATLYIAGVWVQEFEFNSKSIRQKIFKTWNMKYRLDYVPDYYIDISYSSTNSKTRRISDY